ncbi:LOW QUALITY PROTEIN: heme oxygenase 1-like [Scyliorhinus canicula]|uniref:LOW QUALITY PROTEIN: heme oxygenase 1-like n=1 Tax=Scyliorhinus canicula TaxID=7830 RepID=UPI0018F2A2E7|nr:LOW QUALITY PROTEIN: heme oxygenase 1-like [Scyliorhinus canicula]
MENGMDSPRGNAGSTDPDSMPADLSEALKLATKESHELAENSEFMRNFQKGQVTRDQFKLLLESLYFIYTALEEEIERNKDHPAFAPLYFPSELHRKEALEQDLEYFHGPGWRSRIECPRATGKYVSQIQEVGRREPELLVAHAYIRYMGDLSGGQVLKKVAQKALQLPSTGEGLAFFTFDRVTNATKFKQLYRSRMNTLEINRETKERVLDEANRAFLLNVEVFAELEQLKGQNQEHGVSMPADLSEALKLATKESHELAENSEFMRNFQKGQVTRGSVQAVTGISVLHLHGAGRGDREEQGSPGLRPSLLPLRAAPERGPGAGSGIFPRARLEEPHRVSEGHREICVPDPGGGAQGTRAPRGPRLHQVHGRPVWGAGTEEGGPESIAAAQHGRGARILHL